MNKQSGESKEEVIDAVAQPLPGSNAPPFFITTRLPRKGHTRTSVLY